MTCLAFPCLATGLREIHRQKRMSFYTLILRPSRTRTRPSAYPLSLSRSHSSSLTPVLTPALTPPLPLFSSAPSSFVLCVPRVPAVMRRAHSPHLHEAHAAQNNRTSRSRREQIGARLPERGKASSEDKGGKRRTPRPRRSVGANHGGGAPKTIQRRWQHRFQGLELL